MLCRWKKYYTGTLLDDMEVNLTTKLRHENENLPMTGTVRSRFSTAFQERKVKASSAACTLAFRDVG
jgi:hypothetical protein